MLRKFAVLFLITAVEAELSHDICIFFHGELIVNLCNLWSDSKTFPCISLICTAVLLDHALNITFCSTGNIIRKTVYTVLVKRNYVVESLYGIVLLTYIADIECKLAVLAGKSTLAACFFIGVPLVNTCREVGILDDISGSFSSKRNCRHS